jgi:hypothetical protein
MNCRNLYIRSTALGLTIAVLTAIQSNPAQAQTSAYIPSLSSDCLAFGDWSVFQNRYSSVAVDRQLRPPLFYAYPDSFPRLICRYNPETSGTLRLAFGMRDTTIPGDRLANVSLYIDGIEESNYVIASGELNTLSLNLEEIHMIEIEVSCLRRLSHRCDLVYFFNASLSR